MCEKLHALPDAGGIFDQEEQTVNRLVAVFTHLEEWREIEMKKPTNTGSDN